MRALHGRPFGSRNAVAEKVVVLVRVARANAEERGERVGEPYCETGAKWLSTSAPMGNQFARRCPNQRRAKPTMRLESR